MMQNTILNSTHQIDRQSWVDSANGHSDFPIQNLPFAVFKRKDSKQSFRAGVAIGDEIVDLGQLEKAYLFNKSVQKSLKACSQDSLNQLKHMNILGNFQMLRQLLLVHHQKNMYVKI